MSSTNSQINSPEKIATDLISAIGSVEVTIHQRQLQELSEGDVYQISGGACDISSVVKNIRLFNILTVNYEQNENVAQRLTNVFSAIANFGVTVIYLLRFRKDSVTLYLGIGADEPKIITTAYNTFKGAYEGNFPGCNFVNKGNQENQVLLKDIFLYPDEDEISISTVSGCIECPEKEIKYGEGLERLIDGMQGECFDMVILAKAISSKEISNARDNLETLYSQISPFKQSVLTLSQSENLGYAYSVGKAISSSLTQSVSHTTGENKNYSYSESHTTSKTKRSNTSRAIDVGSAILSIAGTGLLFASGALTGNATLASAMMGGVYMSTPISNSLKAAVGDEPETISDAYTTNASMGSHEDVSVSKALAESISKNENETVNRSDSTSRSVQYTYNNKAVENLLADIDKEISALKQAEYNGAFSCATYFIAGDTSVSNRAASLYRSIVLGNGKTNKGLYINTWEDKKNTRKILESLMRFQHPFVKSIDSSASVIKISTGVLIPSSLISLYYLLPLKPLTGLSVTEHAQFSRDTYNVVSKNTSKIHIGNLYHMGIEHNTVPIELDIESLSMHSLITGTTGKGKSTVVYNMLNELYKKGVHYLVIEPAKGEYKDIFANLHNASVYGTNSYYTPLLKINPFSFSEGIHVLEHIDGLMEILSMCWPMYAAMPAVLKDAIERSYTECGWNLSTSINKHGLRIFPTFRDVKEQLSVALSESEYSDENKGNYAGALKTRLNSVSNGIYGIIFGYEEIEPSSLFDRNVIIDLSRVRSQETKSLIMGMLVLKLQEYRQSVNEGPNQSLKHVTVLEEAHNLIKASQTLGGGDVGNVVAKSVEMLSNLIAEMRTYGEGFIIADQAPSELDVSVIRNTNTKIVMCLPEHEDRLRTGRSMGLRDDQIEELSRLPVGVAAVYQNNWAGAVLMKGKNFTEKGERFTAPNLLVEERKDESLLFALKKRQLEKWFTSKPNSIFKDIMALDISSKAKCMLIDYQKMSDMRKPLAYQIIAYEVLDFSQFNKLFVPNMAPDAWLNLMLQIPLFEGNDLSENEKLGLLLVILREHCRRDNKVSRLYYNFGEYLKKKKQDVVANNIIYMPN